MLQFGLCLLKYYYSYQVNEIICIEALHKDLCIKFGYITKMAYCLLKKMRLDVHVGLLIKGELLQFLKKAELPGPVLDIEHQIHKI